MTVLATARRLDRLESLAAELPPGRVLTIAGDLADARFRRELWERALTLPGGVDLLVNNAGVGHYAEFVDQDPERIRQIVELNLMALMDLSQKAAQHMTDRGAGQILQISSVLGFVGIAESAAYAASKHAVNGLVKSLRYELAGTGVRVWAACPGRTVSEFSEVAGRGASKAPSWPGREPTDRVVRGIVRGLDARRAFIFPTWRSWLVVTAASWLPSPVDWLLTRRGPGASRTRGITPTSAP
jgi:short-subunit dehydrogenase